MSKHYFDRSGIPIDDDTAQRLFSDHEYAEIATDELGCDECLSGTFCRVSTIWTGVDSLHGRGKRPHIFETIVFGGRFNAERVHYATEREARSGHARAVLDLRAGRAPWFAKGSTVITRVPIGVRARKRIELLSAHQWAENRQACICGSAIEYGSHQAMAIHQVETALREQPELSR